jgi:hypothetical protein
VTATNSAGTIVGQRHRMPMVDTLAAVNCTPLRLQLNTTGHAQSTGQGTTAGNDPGGNTTPSPKTSAMANAQKLAKAVKACKHKPKKTQRASCLKHAHQKYGAVTQAKKR